MKLTGAIQEALLCLLCYTEEGNLVQVQVQPRQFDPVFRDIAEAAVKYRQQFGQAPGEHTLDLVETLCENVPKSNKQFRALYESMEETRHSLNVEYVLRQASLFARQQGIKVGIAKALDSLERGDEEGILTAEAALAESTTITTNLFDSGTYMHDALKVLKFLDEQVKAFPTGIKELDRLDLGPARKTLHLFLAPTGAGKSWWLCHLAKMGIMSRLRVLFVTLEMSEEKVAQRITQGMFAIRKRKHKVRRVNFQTDEKGQYLGWELQDLKNLHWLGQKGIHAYLTKRLTNLKRRPPLLIKEFPTKKLTVPELEAYLDVLEATEKFIPDLVCLDYADLLAPDRAFTQERHALSDIYMKLRGVAQERNIAIASATQTNKSSTSKKIITEADVAEDWSKIWTADNVVTFNQTVTEKQHGLARLYQAKGRGDRDKFTTLIAQGYDFGAFCLDSCPMDSSYTTDPEGDED